MYKHGNIVMTSPNILNLVVVSKFKKVGEKLLWFHTQQMTRLEKLKFFHWEAELD